MEETGPIQVGDLVILRISNTAFREGYMLWSAPDYEENSLDVKTIIRPNDLMLVVMTIGHNNMHVMLSDGTTGWLKSDFLRRA